MYVTLVKTASRQAVPLIRAGLVTLGIPHAAGAVVKQGGDMPKMRRGFACMPVEARRRIASLGGKAAQAKGTAHQWTKEEASAAGRTGGRASRGRPRNPPVE
jgi:general stress protein YciG